LKAPDYPQVARRTIREMHRQVGELVLDEPSVDLEDGHDFLFGFLLGAVHSVALLPEKLGGSDERLRRGDLGTQYRVPDVDENR
jgi:Uma2 family endonuclease